MKLKLASLVSLIAAVSMPIFASAAITTLDPKTDCEKLNSPHTILIVHVTWCSHCREFLIAAKAVSDLPQYQSWSFYEAEDNEAKQICGLTPGAFPTCYIKNIHNLPSMLIGFTGSQSDAMLKKALDRADI